MKNKTFTIELVRRDYGENLFLNNYKIAGKGFGDIRTTIFEAEITIQDLLKAIPEIKKYILKGE